MSTTTGTPPDLAQLQRAVSDARREFDEAETEERAASATKNACKARLNDRMKAFDEAVVEFRKNAPWDTAWAVRKGSPG